MGVYMHQQGLSQVYAGMCQAYAKHVPGMSGICLAQAMHMHGICLAYAMHVPAMHVPGMCQANARHMTGICGAYAGLDRPTTAALAFCFGFGNLIRGAG